MKVIFFKTKERAQAMEGKVTSPLKKKKSQTQTQKSNPEMWLSPINFLITLTEIRDCLFKYQQE